jgi:hypothetical protein
MENGICSLGLVGKRLDSFLRGQDQQIDLSTARLEFHLVHHRKRSISSRADYEALALPGYLFLDRNRGMSELLAESFRGLLLALANPAAVNDDVTFIGNAINFDSTEVKFAEVHSRALRFTLTAIQFLFEPFRWHFIDGLGLLHVRKMARVFDDHCTRSRDVLAQHFTRSLEWTENV